MYISVRKEEVKGLPKGFQDRAVKLFPMVKLNKFDGKYEQTWKYDNNKEDYIRVKREPKWKYKVYLCGAYRVDGKSRNKQILLETIYYWDIVDKYINADKKQKQIWSMEIGEYYYKDFEESWLDLYVFEDMDGEVFLSIAGWLKSADKSEQQVLCGMITDKLMGEIRGIEEDYKTTSEYKVSKENQSIVKDCIKEAEWLNKENGF